MLKTSIYAKPFPIDFVKKAVESYEKERGKKPRLLVISHQDAFCYQMGSCGGLNHGINEQLKELGLEVTTGDYLNAGEMDLAVGEKDAELAGLHEVAKELVKDRETWEKVMAYLRFDNGYQDPEHLVTFILSLPKDHPLLNKEGGEYILDAAILAAGEHNIDRSYFW